ncbi:uncharacterized protein LOC143300523 [Babylonia areolata]|uniref:uncharacterized protein LOC143300523 n=1 Tax=Babylonia areolata TaxID=304850 RepID=UPI003FD59302
MAAIIRVKRRLDEDPAENLIIQYKRSRTDGAKTDEPAKLCFSLITTVKSKDAALSRPLQKTLRRQQLQTSYKSHNSRRLNQARADNKAKAKANRYRIVNSRRAFNTTSTDSTETGSAESSVETTEKRTEPVAEAASGLDQGPSSDSDVRTSGASSSETSPDSASVQAHSEGDDPIIHDVEVDGDSAGEGGMEVAPSSGSGITLNGQVLVSQPVLPARENNYVYDLYYVNADRQHYDFRDLENILSIEALHDSLVSEADRLEECDEVYDDEDDSNDEGNWRNDYPDRDPDESDDESDVELDADFLEGETYSYRSTLNDDILADAMGTRLNLFGSDASSGSDGNDSDDAYEDDDADIGQHRQRKKGSSYSSYMHRVKQELITEDSDSEDND